MTTLNADQVVAGIGRTPFGSSHFKVRANDWDPIRAKHYGQRPYRPHKQAGHMTAPDQCCPEELPYFGPLQKLPASFLTSHLCFSRVPGQPRTYVQDGIRREAQSVAGMLKEPATHVFSLPSEGNGKWYRGCLH